MNLINILKFRKYIINLLQTTGRAKSHVLIEVFDSLPSLITYLYFFICLNSKKNLKPILYKPTHYNYYQNKTKEFLPFSIAYLFKFFLIVKIYFTQKLKKKMIKK